MKKFKITIAETISDIFEVEAENEEAAIEIAIKNYKNEIFVLEPGNLISKELSIISPDTNIEWIEF